MPVEPSEDVRALRDFIAARVTRAAAGDDAGLAGLLETVRQRFGASLAAVLVYGSWTRGKRDTLIDLYALLDDYAPLPRWQAGLCRLLPPNVYQFAAGEGAGAARAKCAVLSLARFESAMSRDFHSYFWARFVQPVTLLYCRDAATRDRVVAALACAAQTFVRRVTPLVTPDAAPAALWARGFAATYRCELRAERPGYAQGLVDAEPEYYAGLARLVAPLLNTGPQRAGPRAAGGIALRPRFSWWLRRVQGKLLSAARLAKAATMFEAPLDYILWKIERHSGVHVEVTARQRRHPFLFALPLVWRLYRQGAFR